MHILLVNDDGIKSPGIWALQAEACKRGHRVTVAAPDNQRSASSHSITLFEPLFVKNYSTDKYFAYSVSGTPADCTRLAILNLCKEKPDIIVSGINNGYNDGQSIHYSGTLGSAREGIICGYKAIAVSIEEGADDLMLENAAVFAINAAEKVFSSTNLPEKSILNINFPAISPKKLKPAKMATLSSFCHADGYIKRTSPRAGIYYWLNKDYTECKPEINSDTYFLKKGYIACSFISIAVEKNIICPEFIENLE